MEAAAEDCSLPMKGDDVVRAAWQRPPLEISCLDHWRPLHSSCVEHWDEYDAPDENDAPGANSLPLWADVLG